LSDDNEAICVQSSEKIIEQTAPLTRPIDNGTGAKSGRGTWEHYDRRYGQITCDPVHDQVGSARRRCDQAVEIGLK
jgi:hypothetical protein